MKDNHFIKPAIIFLDVVLCLVLVVLMFQYRKESKERQEQLIQESVASSAAAEESKAKESAEKEQKKAEKETEQTKEESENETESSSEESDIEDGSGRKLSFRGDSFCDTEDIAREGLGTFIKAALKYGNYQVAQFDDYSIGNAGSISQMAYAGVDEETCQDFITRHETNGTSEIQLTERKIRSFTEDELVRSDYDAIPIICIGYYGGWGEDIDELIEQQHLILDTYDETDEFLIVGSAGNSPDSTAYNRAMREEWGEHYLSINESSPDDFANAQEKGALASKIVEKLDDLGYIEAE